MHDEIWDAKKSVDKKMIAYNNKRMLIILLYLAIN